MNSNKKKYLIIDELSDGMGPTAFWLHKGEIEKLLDRMYELRNFEIERLWQRSVFLWAFIALFLTGYGKLIIESWKYLSELSDENSMIFHFLALICSLMIFLFSCIWIFMARGSKYWYEVYEDKIMYLEKYLPIPTKNKYDYAEMDKAGGFLKLMKAYRYSPSKINTVLGVVITLFSGIAVFVHFFSIMCKQKYLPATYQEIEDYLCPWVVLFSPLLVWFLHWFCVASKKEKKTGEIPLLGFNHYQKEGEEIPESGKESPSPEGKGEIPESGKESPSSEGKGESPESGSGDEGAEAPKG